jgi:predicted nucleic acid-binding protein
LSPRKVVLDTNLYIDWMNRGLREAAGREVRRASLVGDVLIAHTARSLGASLVTAGRDYEAIRSVLDFDLEVVSA